MSELKHAFKIYFPYIKLTRGSPLKVPLVYCTCAVGVCVVWDLSVVYLMMTKPNEQCAVKNQTISLSVWG